MAGCLIHSHKFGGYQPFLVFDEGKRIAVDCIQDGLSNTEIMEEISRVPESKKFDVVSLDLMIAKLRPAYGVIPYRGKEYRNMRQVRVKI